MAVKHSCQHSYASVGSGPRGQSCLWVTFAGAFSPYKTIHCLELVTGKPAEVSDENKSFGELLVGSKEAVLICVQIEMLKICAMLGRESSRKSAFFSTAGGKV